MNDERAELVAGLKALSVLHRIKPNECAMLRKAADYIESQPAGTPFAWTTICAVTAEPVFSTSPPDEPNVAEWRPLYFHPSRVDAAAERDAEIRCLDEFLRMASEPIGQQCCGQGNPQYGCCGNAEPVFATPNEVFQAMQFRLDALTAQQQESGS